MIDLFILDPLREMIVKVSGFVPTLLISLGILFIGYVFAHLVERLVTMVFKTVGFDTIADKIGITKILKKGAIRNKPSGVIGCLTYWTLMFTVITVAVKALGFAPVNSVLDKLLAYIPSVVTGTVILIFGMLIAKFVATLVYVTAKNTDMPMPATLSRLSKYAIVVYVAIMYLKEIGFADMFTGENYTIFVTGIVFTLALAFGLAGKDVASKYLGVLNDHKTS